jgi:hypothetical protein
MLSHRLQEGAPHVPDALRDSPGLPPVGWGYLTSDTQALPLEAGRSYCIGRQPSSDLVLKSRSVSGEHALIDVNDSGRAASLRDLGSLNGCFINNVRIKGQREPLRHGDNVRFGFDARVWMVDCTAERLAREQQAEAHRSGSAAMRKSSRAAGLPRDDGVGAWVHRAEGAAAADPISEPRPPPTALQSGQTPHEAFFARREPGPPPRRPPPPPPPEQLRTSESDAGSPHAWSQPRGGHSLRGSPRVADSKPPFDSQRANPLRQELDGMQSQLSALHQSQQALGQQSPFGHPSPLGSKLARRAAAAELATRPAADGGREARLEGVLVAQQQQLVALRARLSKTDRRVLALSARDEGRALLLAEGEAAAAAAACKLKEDELAQLQASLASLEYAAAAGGRGPGLPAELQQFVIERARETAVLRDKLGRLQAAAGAAARGWTALEREVLVARREREAALTDAQAARDAERRAREVAAASSSRHSVELSQLQAKLADAASEGGKGGRSAAARFVVERLHAHSSRLEALEGELARAREALALSEEGARRAAAVASMAAAEVLPPSEPESVLLERARDEVRKLRAACDPAAAQQQQAVLRALFMELREERQHVSDLEAALALESAEGIEAPLWEQGEPRERVLAQLLKGKELELRQMEGQVARMHASAAGQGKPHAEAPEEEGVSSAGEGGSPVGVEDLPPTRYAPEAQSRPAQAGAAEPPSRPAEAGSVGTEGGADGVRAGAKEEEVNVPAAAPAPVEASAVFEVAAARGPKEAAAAEGERMAMEEAAAAEAERVAIEEAAAAESMPLVEMTAAKGAATKEAAGAERSGEGASGEEADGDLTVEDGARTAEANPKDDQEEAVEKMEHAEPEEGEEGGASSEGAGDAAVANSEAVEEVEHAEPAEGEEGKASSEGAGDAAVANSEAVEEVEHAEPAEGEEGKASSEGAGDAAVANSEAVEEVEHAEPAEGEEGGAGSEGARDAAVANSEAVEEVEHAEPAEGEEGGAGGEGAGDAAVANSEAVEEVEHAEPAEGEEGGAGDEGAGDAAVANAVAVEEVEHAEPAKGEEGGAGSEGAGDAAVANAVAVEEVEHAEPAKGEEEGAGSEGAGDAAVANAVAVEEVEHAEPAKGEEGGAGSEGAGDAAGANAVVVEEVEHAEPAKGEEGGAGGEGAGDVAVANVAADGDAAVVETPPAPEEPASTSESG